MSDSLQPHRWQPTRLLCPWDSPGKNTGVGCHFLLQCMKVKSESEVAQSCPTLSDPMDCSLQSMAPRSMGFSRQEYWSGVPLPSPRRGWMCLKGITGPTSSWPSQSTVPTLERPPHPGSFQNYTAHGRRDHGSNTGLGIKCHFASHEVSLHLQASVSHCACVREHPIRRHAPLWALRQTAVCEKTVQPQSHVICWYSLRG